MQWDGDPGRERGMRRVWDSRTLPVTLALPHPPLCDPHPSSAGGCARGLPGWHLELPPAPIPPAPGLAFISGKKLPWEPLVFLRE